MAADALSWTKGLGTRAKGERNPFKIETSAVEKGALTANGALRPT